MAFLKLVVYIIGFAMAFLVARRSITMQQTGPGRSRMVGASAGAVVLALLIAVLTLAVSASFGQVPGVGDRVRRVRVHLQQHVVTEPLAQRAALAALRCKARLVGFVAGYRHTFLHCGQARGCRYQF